MDIPEELKVLFVELGKAINGSLQGSEEMKDALRRINATGYHVQILLEVTIGFAKIKGLETSQDAEPVTRATLTDRDTEFLKSLKITLSDPREDKQD